MSDINMARLLQAKLNICRAEELLQEAEQLLACCRTPTDETKRLRFETIRDCVGGAVGELNGLVDQIERL
jgi:hypothetical protein